MKRFYVFLCATFVALSLQAVPAMPGKRLFTNPDGTTVEYEVRGDEFYHFMVDADNNMLEESADGFLKIKEKVSLDSVAARRARSKAPSVERIRKAGTVNLAPRGLFILVNFSDSQFKSSNTLAAMKEMINSTGHTYNYNGAPGSVRDYFIDQSGGKYNPQFDVYGPVNLSNTVSYYGRDNSTSNKDPNAYKVIIDACQALNNQIDFSQYDADNDGFIDFVYIIYAGKGQADGGGTSTIWPHQWYIYRGAGQTVTLDGKKLDSYACGPELNGSTGDRNGAGTLCHEFGHVLGLPDYYDTDYGTNSDNGATPGSWHIMDGGSYNNKQITPPNYAAHDKYFLGWYTPTVLKDPENVTLPADGQTYRMINAAQTQQTAKSTNTIYYLENRQKTGWDAYLPGHGMLVWKVTYNTSKWSSNTPNNTAGELNYALISASGATTNIGQGKDPFPGTKNVTSYTPITGNALTDIEESNSAIYFKFNGGITRAYTVTFDAGEHATCATSSLTQSSMGATITLPDVTVTSANYKFLGWSVTENAASGECGMGGDAYIPKRDLTLYAVVVPDGYWVRFNTETLGTTIGHGSCDVKDMRENGIGAGIVLPAFTPDPGYAFQFWVYPYIGSDNKTHLGYGGEAGETFYPSKDSMILYSYVYPSDSVYLTYDTYHVEKLSGPDGPWIKQGEALTATFVPTSGYTFNSQYAQYEVKVDGEVVDGAATLQNDTLTVALTAEQVIYDVEIKAIAVVATSGGCEDYSYTYTSKVSGTTQVLNDVTWNITLGNTSASISYDNSNGEMFGTSTTTTKSVQYVTSAFNECDIQSIVLTCGHTSNSNTKYASVAVYIGNQQVGTTQSLKRGNQSKTLTFTNSNNLKGDVKFVISNSNTDAFYVKSINVNMAPDPNAPTKLNVEYMQALNFTSGSSRLWQVDLTPLSTNYPDIMTWFYGNDMTTIAGSHQTLEVDYQLSESDEASYAAYEPICNITYLGTHPTYTSYPQYHVYMEWEDYATHDRYYIDSDVVGLLFDLDAYQNGDEDYQITPTGDTDPVYYTVRHLLQDTEGDGYTLVAIDTLHTAAGTSVTANTRSYTGFYSPQYQTKTVTTNYATVFEYKYDRMTLNVEFIVEGNVWQSEPVRYGAIPNYHGETPEKQASAQHTYTFTGWTPTLRPVRQADSYTALFEPSPRSYTITWLNDDGTEIDQTTVEYGVVPTHDDATKEATAEFTYTFAGWDPEVVAVTGDATYTATFTSTKNSYTITWLNDDGTEIDKTTVEYGVVPTHDDATKEATAEFTFTFAGWNPEVVAVTGDATYTATFTSAKNSYTITWLNDDGTEIDHNTVEYGVVPTHDDATKEATAEFTFTFAGWDPEVVAVTGDATYTATFTSTKNSYTITWLNDDGAEIDQTTVEYGIVPTHDDATKEATAEFTYTFAGWDPEVVAVTGDATYTATFTSTKNSYTITWLNDDGTEIDKTTVEYGVVPTHDDATKEATAEFTYTFAGWDPEVVAVTGDATYTATFTSHPNTPTGIEQVIISGNSISGPEGMRVYDFNGRDVTDIKNHLYHGLFIIVVDGQSRKVMIQ